MESADQEGVGACEGLRGTHAGGGCFFTQSLPRTMNMPCGAMEPANKRRSISGEILLRYLEISGACVRHRGPHAVTPPGAFSVVAIRV